MCILLCSVGLFLSQKLGKQLGMFFHVSPKSSRFLAHGSWYSAMFVGHVNVLETLLLSVYSRYSLNNLKIEVHCCPLWKWKMNPIGTLFFFLPSFICCHYLRDLILLPDLWLKTASLTPSGFDSLKTEMILFTTPVGAAVTCVPVTACSRQVWWGWFSR